MSAYSGKVYLIGAGPGDPGLLTLRALEVLQRADVVLYDYLVNPVALRHARANAETICLGKHGRTRIWTQDEINERLILLAKQGKHVARLKSGDPSVFGRLTEELTALRLENLDYEVVPGVTAALAAGGFAGIPITHRELASAVALITGQEKTGREDSNLDFEAFAKFPGTLVFYMGVTTVKSWAGKLIAAGKPGETPTAIIRRCSLPDQRTITCRLDEVASELTPTDKVRPPVIVIVGEVVNLRDSLSWFETRPLFGKTILLARPEEPGGKLTRLLEERGAEVLAHPVITIGPAEDFGPLDRAIARLGEFDWIVFSSVHGVTALFERLHHQKLDTRALGRAKVAAVGPATAASLLEHGVRCDLTPTDAFRAESIVTAIGAQAKGKHFLLPRASRGRDALASGLTGAGGVVEEVVTYASTDVVTADETAHARLSNGEVDWVLVTSSAIARSLVHLFGAALKQTKLASLSPLTSQTLNELGYPPAVEAAEATLESLLQSLEHARDA